MRSFLKWAGSKYAIRKHILEHLPAGKRLIEPFAGSGVIFLNSHYSSYTLGENNADLINLYQLIQQEGTGFIEDCRAYFAPKNNSAKIYYAFRNDFNNILGNVSQKRQRALLFLYLNRHGYNGLCRYNSQGYYNVPFGQHNKVLFPEKRMLHFHEKSRNARFIHADFRQTLTSAKPGDIVYCDPPYVPLSDTAKFTRYTQQEFTQTDQAILAETAEQLASRGVCVVISNHDTPETRRYYCNASITSLSVQRNISCLGQNRQKAPELIAVFK